MYNVYGVCADGNTNKETTIYSSTFEFCCVCVVYALFSIYKTLMVPKRHSGQITELYADIDTHSVFPMRTLYSRS